jgi:hypothetical protein
MQQQSPSGVVLIGKNECEIVSTHPHIVYVIKDKYDDAWDWLTQNVEAGGYWISRVPYVDDDYTCLKKIFFMNEADAALCKMFFA